MKRTLSLQRSGSFSLARGRLVVALMGAAFFCAECFGQGLYPDWVRTYHYDLAKTNQALKCLLTSDGLVVAGSSASPFGDSDYLVIKYGFDGVEAWVQRYGSAPLAQDSLRAMAIDPAGNIFVTGTSDTVKYDPKGNMVWHAPYGGRAIVANADFAYVTGFSEVDFATAQLTNSNGGVGWVRTYDGPQHDVDISAGIAMAKNGEVIVAGWQTVLNMRTGPIDTFYAIRYGPDGLIKWQDKSAQWLAGGHNEGLSGIVIDAIEGGYVLGHLDGQSPLLARFNPNGSFVWMEAWPIAGVGFGLKLVPNQNVVAVGAAGWGVVSEYSPAQSIAWNQYYKGLPGSVSATTCIDVAPNGEIYAGGYTLNGSQNYDIFVWRLGSDGSPRFSLTYDSPNHGSDVPNAIALDKTGGVYVTGYSTTAFGGTEFLTIKFMPDAAVRSNPDGTMHVEFRSTPGQPYAIQATTDFFNWRSVITNTADANGRVQFEDTNATSIPYRFYRGSPNP